MYGLELSATYFAQFDSFSLNALAQQLNGDFWNDSDIVYWWVTYLFVTIVIIGSMQLLAICVECREPVDEGVGHKATDVPQPFDPRVFLPMSSFSCQYHQLSAFYV